MSVEPSEYVKRLPVGQRIAFPAEGIPGWEIFPFEGDLRIKVLEQPVLPEPPRQGEEGAENCQACATPDAEYIWTDEYWRLKGYGPAAVPAVLMLEPRGHHDQSDLPVERATEIGPLFQRIERAVMGLGGIARVHNYRFGDGATHLHYWFFARPEGMMQLRGSCLAIWDDLLPKAPEAEWAETKRRIAAAMATDGGIAHV
ncbi:hypothetical protein KDK95_21815 [Actinospica sp. MGRD01-02]|uniref:Diadenosine tetraphosphate (Ap4A) hydrolase n=1 Tax=Actinospica acidithermotolerans TaxID=2828514 RepID=A0A941EEJ5_9ACTN|nr:hypothetical protein [Actinospica acidithermotolerans]MBR7828963.1 hypothetical protein [Actinospica acidithermotolerans]